MKEKIIEIQTNPSYSIFLGKNLLTNSRLVQLCLEQKKRLALLSDERLSGTIAHEIQKVLKEAEMEVEIFPISSGEKFKTRETKQQLEDQLLEKKFGRDSCFLALGGGMVTDLVGYLASTYCRGVPWVALPTTLLGMVDAAIGGKTGVNTPHGKNLIGTFYPPLAVISDVAVLQSLPPQEWRNGVVEMIKHACIADKKLFEQLEISAKNLFKDDEMLLNLIEQSCRIKKKIVEQDERESGMRELLNFGHTIGHAIETLENYRLSHGEAVAIGMLVEASLAQAVGYFRKQELLKVKKILEAYQLPLQTKVFHNTEIFLEQLRLDKKSKASLPHFVLLKKIGEAHIEEGKFSFPVKYDLLQKILLEAI